MTWIRVFCNLHSSHGQAVKIAYTTMRMKLHIIRLICIFFSPSLRPPPLSFSLVQHQQSSWGITDFSVFFFTVDGMARTEVRVHQRHVANALAFKLHIRMSAPSENQITDCHPLIPCTHAHFFLPWMVISLSRFGIWLFCSRIKITAITYFSRTLFYPHKFGFNLDSFYVLVDGSVPIVQPNIRGHIAPGGKKKVKRFNFQVSRMCGEKIWCGDHVSGQSTIDSEFPGCCSKN